MLESQKRGLTLRTAYVASTEDEASDLLANHACAACGTIGQYIAGDKGMKQSIADLVLYYRVGMRCKCGFINFVYLVYNDIARARNPKVLSAKKALERVSELNLLTNPQLEELYITTKVLAFQGKIQEAITAARSCVHLFPKDTSAMYNLAVMLLQVKDYQTSLDLLKQVIKQDSTYSAAWYQIGILMEETGRFNEALDSYSRFLILRPQHTDGLARKNACERRLQSESRVVSNKDSIST